ncbi:TPA: hypothetical protein DCX16_00440 [bacterium]|nr:hypothetical protein [bacterium]
MRFSIEIFKKDDGTYVASCPGLDLVSYGSTVEKAVIRLNEIINFYLSSAQELGITIEELCFSEDSSLKKLN